MGAGPGNSPTINRYVQTIVYDTGGQPVFVPGVREFAIFEPDGTISQYEQSDSIQLVDGLVWNPAMMSGSHPVLLTCCSACRKPSLSWSGYERPTHGLLSVRNARVCVACGAVTCPRHRRLTGRHWRCIRCARLYRLKRVLRPLFFSYEES